MTGSPNGTCSGISFLLPTPQPQPLRAEGCYGGTGRAILSLRTLRAILQMRRCLPSGSGSISVRGTLRQSSAIVLGGSAGLRETYKEAAGPLGFQGNLISSTSALQESKGKDVIK